ncbi:tryptophan synthase subunit alpha [Dokdonella koreensis]|uniref:Tryptophan synthase alpha chain n=1 Tax=Dokdonella koreensis DS-123 TaxID=1300342 RepID=A0A160DU77_9GAMM|nr:tryptophan synthase subunit alpha [Dokdonella koreensis]ANB17985.1 Tryptophan synthase alpha chain [Dokdonella koreensis DS-123]
MNRIDTRFADLRAAGRTGLIPFVTAGDPSADGITALMHALVAAGADLIELGVPFSDPMADGPVIQHASERAVARGVGIALILEQVAAFRQRDTTTPVVLMGYLNPIEIYGWTRFAGEAAAAGVDGVLLVDCPVEEAQSAEAVTAAGLHQIFLVAPTTTDRRLAAVTARAHGFLYLVSFAGVTGANRLDTTAIAQRAAAIRRDSDIPIAVGFGVRDADSAVAIAGCADAVIIGSALVERLAGSTDAGDAAARAQAFLAPIRAALDAARGAPR